MFKQSQSISQEFQEPLAASSLEDGEERKRERKLLPRRPGEKKLKLEGTEEERERLHLYLQDQMVAQSVSGISRKRSLSVGKWDSTNHLATVTIQKGSHWSTHGHTHSGQLVLEGHEILFLMEMGCLQMEEDSVCWTLQQAYSVIIGDHLPLQTYMVISSLKRSGYIVRRHCVSRCQGKKGEQTAETDQGLQLVPSCPQCQLISSYQQTPWWSILDVYRPGGGGGRFKKSNPGAPHFRVCVASPQDPFPSSSLLSQLSSLQPAALETSLKWCIVDNGSLTFYTISSGTVCTLTTNIQPNN